MIAPEPDGAATLLADHVELSGDRILTASGGVVVWFEGARLVAERVIYDGTAGTMRIEGPIHLTEPGNAGTPDEAVLVADSAQLDEGLRDGILKGARLVLARELQFAAAEVRRNGTLIAAVLLIATTVLSFLAALGISTLVFELLDLNQADPTVPLFGFVFLVALGIDYNIFLMSRVREESKTHGTRPGILAVLLDDIAAAGSAAEATR